ncbi:MAG TPA: protease pro-enzyme activation domain-containing protein, partial [Streptosporangiaceae bacterium]
MKLFQWARQRRSGVVLAAGAAGSLMLVGLAAPASGATHPPSATKVAVPQGIGTAALKDASVFGPTPASTPETVSFILKARNLGQLEANVQAGMPSGYQNVHEFASSYGQPGSSISALRSYLSSFGLSSTSDADGLDVTATGTAGAFDNALSVQQNQYNVPAVPARHGMAGRPAMTIH